MSECRGRLDPFKPVFAQRQRAKERRSESERMNRRANIV
jgi:hypothetical protein